MNAETLMTLARAAEWMAANSEHTDRDGRDVVYLYDAANEAREAAKRTDAHVTRNDDPVQFDPFVVCDVCDEQLCTIEEGDHISVLASVVSEHKCGQVPS